MGGRRPSGVFYSFWSVRRPCSPESPVPEPGCSLLGLCSSLLWTGTTLEMRFPGALSRIVTVILREAGPSVFLSFFGSVLDRLHSYQAIPRQRCLGILLQYKMQGAGALIFMGQNSPEPGPACLALSHGDSGSISVSGAWRGPHACLVAREMF